MSKSKSAVVAVVAPVVAPVAKPVHVARFTTDKSKGKAVYLYGAVSAPVGVGAGLVIQKGANFATYKPRTSESECWAWFVASNAIGCTVQTCKLVAVESGHKLAIAGMLRHAARSGAIVLS